MAEKYYVTTAIDYVNAEPHIGHAYQKIVADVLARWNRLLGKEVYFLTGTDEHGKKIEDTAKKAGKDTKEFVDQTAVKFKEAWDALNIKPDRFIRTTDEDHKKLVAEFIKKCNDNGDIYKDSYEGYYCVGCEGYKTEKDLVNGECEIHPGKPVETIKEESYFFKLSKYQDFLLQLYEEHPEFIQPKSRRNEIINRVKEGLKDLSITRTSFKWGIPFPLEPETHITYVWFDALINYITGAGENKEYWPASCHLLGKDNTWFHTVYWPAMLKSAGYELPKVTYNHGFLSVNGQKISKSLGNVISPKYLSETYGADSVRYFALRHFPFAAGDDGDFSESALVDRHNNELLNKLGNLVSRTAGLVEKNGIEVCENHLQIDKDKVISLMEKYEFDKALNEIFAFIDTCNEYVQSQKPWETKDKRVLYQLADAIKQATVLLSPFIPESCEKISKQFDFELTLDQVDEPLKGDAAITKGDYIFRRVEYTAKAEDAKPNKAEKVDEDMSNVKNIKFEDFTKLDLRVAEIVNVEEIEGADKLYKLTMDLGDEQRMICAGIKKYYSMDELQNKQVVIIANLEPRKMRGIESQGMMIAAGSLDSDTCILLTPDKKVANGTKVS